MVERTLALDSEDLGLGLGNDIYNSAAPNACLPEPRTGPYLAISLCRWNQVMMRSDWIRVVLQPMAANL